MVDCNNPFCACNSEEEVLKCKSYMPPYDEVEYDELLRSICYDCGGEISEGTCHCDNLGNE